MKERLKERAASRLMESDAVGVSGEIRETVSFCYVIVHTLLIWLNRCGILSLKKIQIQRKKIKLVDEDTQRWVAQPDMGLRKRLEKESILRNNTEGSTIKRLVSRYPQTMPEHAMLRRNLMG